MQYSPLKPRAFLPVVNQLPARPHTTDGVMSRKVVEKSVTVDSLPPESSEAEPLAEAKDDAADDSPVFVDSRESIKIPDSAYFRGIWQTALNKCRAADEDRRGVVSKTSFLQALDESDTRKVICLPQYRLK